MHERADHPGWGFVEKPILDTTDEAELRASSSMCSGSAAAGADFVGFFRFVTHRLFLSIGRFPLFARFGDLILDRRIHS